MCSNWKNESANRSNPTSPPKYAKEQKDEEVELNINNFRVEEKAYYDELNKAFEEALPIFTAGQYEGK